jgi:hypothetical protein
VTDNSIKSRTIAAIDRAMKYCLQTLFKSDGMENVIVNLDTDKIAPIREVYETIQLLRSTVFNKDEVYVLQNLVRNEAGVLSYSKSAPEYEKWKARLKTILDKLEVISGQS